MSVTFYTARYVEDATRGTVLNYNDAPDAVAVEVNMANLNAARILAVLGYEPDAEEGLVGRATADDMLGRLLLATALEPADEGMPTYRMNPGEPGAAVYMGARRPGYTQDRLAALTALAEYAKANDYMLAWA